MFGLISFRIDWLHLLAVQGTLKSLLQDCSLKASILQHSAFFLVQLFTSIHDSWKDHSFDYMDFVGKVMSLLFSMLPRFDIAFLPRRKCILISCLQSLFAVILEPSKIKFATVSTFNPSICIREQRNKDLSFNLTINYAFYLLNNDSRDLLVIIINSLIEKAFYTSKCSYCVSYNGKFSALPCL